MNGGHDPWGNVGGGMLAQLNRPSSADAFQPRYVWGAGPFYLCADADRRK